MSELQQLQTLLTTPDRDNLIAGSGSAPAPHAGGCPAPAYAAGAPVPASSLPSCTPAVVEVDSGQLGVDSAMSELQQLQTLLTTPDRDNLIR
jgi:hypothetical protein